MTSVRARKAPKKKGAEKSTVKVRYGAQILVEDLRVGDEIVTMWETDKNTGLRTVARSKKVERIDECPGQWRTHIHVNRMDCYDIRQHVHIVV